MATMDLEPRYYEYNQHKLLFDDDDDDMLKAWDDQIDCVDLPLVVDMSHWIGCITRSFLPYDIFLDKISDGIILCNFGNTLNTMTGFGGRRQITNIQYPECDGPNVNENYDRHNIAAFLQWCKSYGLQRDWLFTVADLADHMNGRKVLRALLWIGRIAHYRGVPAPQIVKMEEKYELRYYDLLRGIINHKPVPVRDLFLEENNSVKEKKRRSVTSFFGRRSSRNSVNSNISMNSSVSGLPSVAEDRKHSIIFGHSKKKNKNKKKDLEQISSSKDETDVITPTNDSHQMYLQIMTLMYHKGFQRAKPQGALHAVMEEWQADVHATLPHTLPDEEPYEVKKGWSLTRSMISPSPRGSPVSPRLRSPDQFNAHSPTLDAIIQRRTRTPSNKEAKKEKAKDSSSDNAFTDDDKPSNGNTTGNATNSENVGIIRSTTIFLDEYNIFGRIDEQPPANKNSVYIIDDVNKNTVEFDLAPDDKEDRFNILMDRLTEEADNEVKSIELKSNDDHSKRTNPILGLQDPTSELSNIRRRKVSSRQTNTSIPGSGVFDEEEEEGQGKVATQNITPIGDIEEDSRSERRRSFLRSRSRETGPSIGKIVLTILFPCRLCIAE